MGKKEKADEMSGGKNDEELLSNSPPQRGVIGEKGPHSAPPVGNTPLRKENPRKGENASREHVEDTHISNANGCGSNTPPKYSIFIDKEGAINSILSSTFAGIMSRTVTAPLDRVKYIMQVTNNLPISEIFEIIKKDGIVCGFFRGNCVNIVKIIPELSIKMYSYEFFKVNVYNYYRGGGGISGDGGVSGISGDGGVSGISGDGGVSGISGDGGAAAANSAAANSAVANSAVANVSAANYAREQENLDIPFFIRFIIGSSSGVIAALFIYPLEIVKTRLIVSNKNDHNGIAKCFYNIYKNERCRNFYNGLSMHLYGVILFSGCNMSIYDYMKYLFFTLYRDYIHSTHCIPSGGNSGGDGAVEGGTPQTTSSSGSSSSGSSSSGSSSSGSNSSGSSSSGSSSSGSSSSGSSSGNRISGRDGGETFFKYNLLNGLSRFTKNSTHWNNPPYEHHKESHLNKSECSYCNYRVKNVNCLSFLFFGITSSFIAQIVSYPFLVLRTRMQTLNNEIATNYLNSERKHIKSCSFILYNVRVYGFRSLYRGIYVNLLRTIPATSITWFAYEYAMRKLQAGVKL